MAVRLVVMETTSLPPGQTEEGKQETEKSKRHSNLSGVELKQVQETKFLAVIIDDKWSWKPHIEET